MILFTLILIMLSYFYMVKYQMRDDFYFTYALVGMDFAKF